MIQPTDQLSVTLDAAAWNTVMQVLSDGPFRVVAPLIQEIQAQCNGRDRGERGGEPSAGGGS